ncbi:helix-turn-helix domain-containing protein [Streptomyces sp. BBFR109]|uniref:helix-turn-helix domain-containing protein n=1 Tax=Streptomyces sp. BBFR109 TaxID=3448172 RepID=UPI003F7573C7
MSRSTAHRILVTLQRTGFLRHDPGQRGYSAGPQLVHMGLAAIAQLDATIPNVPRDRASAHLPKRRG